MFFLFMHFSAPVTYTPKHNTCVTDVRNYTVRNRKKKGNVWSASTIKVYVSLQVGESPPFKLCLLASIWRLLQVENRLWGEEREDGARVLLQSLTQLLASLHQSTGGTSRDGASGLWRLVLRPCNDYNRLHVHPLQEGQSKRQALDHFPAVENGAVHLHRQRWFGLDNSKQICSSGPLPPWCMPKTQQLKVFWFCSHLHPPTLHTNTILSFSSSCAIPSLQSIPVSWIQASGFFSRTFQLGHQ